MGYSLDILNNIRDNASDAYKSRIPEATQANIAEVGNAITNYEATFNEFMTTLIHKIGKTLIESKLFKNKLAVFKCGEIMNQQDVEEIFVDMAKAAVAYDPDGKNPLGRRTPSDTIVFYHRMNRRDCYEITIGDVDFLRAFKSEASLDQFIKAQINSVYSRAAHDEWILMKELLADHKDSYFDYQVDVINADDVDHYAKRFVKTLRKAINDVGFASDQYNEAGVTTWSNPEDLVLLVNKDVVAEVDVEVLAKAFNLGKTDFNVPVIVMDDFGSMTNTYGLLIDKDFFRVWDTLSRMETQRNAQGLFTNFFYHVHQILSLSPFKTAVRFTTDEVKGVA